MLNSTHEGKHENRGRALGRAATGLPPDNLTAANADRLRELGLRPMKGSAQPNEQAGRVIGVHSPQCTPASASRARWPERLA